MTWFLVSPCHHQWASYQYVKLRVEQTPRMPGTFSPPPRVWDPDMHHSTCVTYVPWCRLGSLTSGFFWSWWRGKPSRDSQCMGNPQFYVSGKRPMLLDIYDNRFHVFNQEGFQIPALHQCGEMVKNANTFYVSRKAHYEMYCQRRRCNTSPWKQCPRNICGFFSFGRYRKIIRLHY